MSWKEDSSSPVLLGRRIRTRCGWHQAFAGGLGEWSRSTFYLLPFWNTTCNVNISLFTFERYVFRAARAASSSKIILTLRASFMQSNKNQIHVAGIANKGTVGQLWEQIEIIILKLQVPWTLLLKKAPSPRASTVILRNHYWASWLEENITRVLSNFFESFINRSSSKW